LTISENARRARSERKLRELVGERDEALMRILEQAVYHGRDRGAARPRHFKTENRGAAKCIRTRESARRRRS